MARNKTEVEVEGEAEASKTDTRYIMVTDPKTGEERKRVEWIREVFQDESSEFYGLSLIHI